jgi:putative RNA 2'-phosphotransferase
MHSDEAVSRRLSYVLRHNPGSAGIALDAAGWVDIDALLTGLADTGFPLTEQRLRSVVASNDKSRFSIDGGRIRAAQGHSVPVDLGLVPHRPPALLYHGTVARSVDAIQQDGLRAGERHHVHLSPDVTTARTVGARRGIPVVFAVDTSAMHVQGHIFFVTDNGVWLTEHVPPRFLRRLPD